MSSNLQARSAKDGAHGDSRPSHGGCQVVKDWPPPPWRFVGFPTSGLPGSLGSLHDMIDIGSDMVPSLRPAHCHALFRADSVTAHLTYKRFHAFRDYSNIGRPLFGVYRAILQILWASARGRQCAYMINAVYVWSSRASCRWKPAGQIRSWATDMVNLVRSGRSSRSKCCSPSPDKHMDLTRFRTCTRVRS